MSYRDWVFAYKGPSLKIDCLKFSLDSIFISLWLDLMVCCCCWGGCKQEELVSITSCFNTKWLVLLSFCILRLVLHTKFVTDTGLTKFWWLELLDELLFRISNPPPPWIWERLRTSGGVLVELEEQLLLLLCTTWWVLESLE